MDPGLARNFIRGLTSEAILQPLDADAALSCLQALHSIFDPTNSGQHNRNDPFESPLVVQAHRGASDRESRPLCITSGSVSTISLH